MLRILSTIKHSPKITFIRKYTNLLYYDPNFVNIDLRVLDIVEVDGYKFYATDQINSIQKVKDNLWFEGVGPNDIVVDVGANIGAIAIPLAFKAKQVYAVEPLFFQELEANVRLNGLTNVQVLSYAMGSEMGFTSISFSQKNRKNIPTFPFKKIKESVGAQINFLKMDGEGCEWDIHPEELEGIRELRIEFHIRRNKVKECKRKYKEYTDWMESSGYEIYIEHPNYGPDPYDKEDYMVRASLRR